MTLPKSRVHPLLLGTPYSPKSVHPTLLNMMPFLMLLCNSVLPRAFNDCITSHFFPQ